jgi:hypothetical protein
MISFRMKRRILLDWLWNKKPDEMVNDLGKIVYCHPVNSMAINDAIFTPIGGIRILITPNPHSQCCMLITLIDHEYYPQL